MTNAVRIWAGWWERNSNDGNGLVVKDVTSAMMVGAKGMMRNSSLGARESKMGANC